MGKKKCHVESWNILMYPKHSEWETESFSMASPVPLKISSLAWASPSGQKKVIRITGIVHTVPRNSIRKRSNLKLKRTPASEKRNAYDQHGKIIWGILSIRYCVWKLKKNVPVLIARWVWIPNRTSYKQPLVIRARKRSIKILGTQKCWRGWPTA